MKNKYEHLKGTSKRKKEHSIKPAPDIVAPLNKEKTKETKKMETKAVCLYCISYIKPTCDKHNKFTKLKDSCGDFKLK